MKGQIKHFLFSPPYFGGENKKTFYLPTFFAGEKIETFYFHARFLLGGLGENSFLIFSAVLGGEE